MLDIIIFLLQIVLGITMIYRGVTNRIEPMDVKIFKNPKHMYVMSIMSQYEQTNITNFYFTSSAF